MAKSRQDGIFSAGGLLGLVSPDEKPRLWFDSPFEFGYEAYLKGHSIGAYTPYLSQVGGQGMFFAFLDTIVPLSPSIKLTLFHILTSLLTALILTLVVLWFYLEFGLLVAMFSSGFYGIFAVAGCFRTKPFLVPLGILCAHGGGNVLFAT